MRTTALLSCLALTLFARLPSAYAAVEATPLTAQNAYDHVQKLREASSEIVEKNPSVGDLHRAIGLLRSALSYMDERAVQDLAVGNEGLFFRGLDARIDLAELYVRTSQIDLALTTLEQISSLYWVPDLGTYLADQNKFSRLEHEPRFQAVLKVSTIPRRLYESKALASNFKSTLTSAERAAGVSIFWNQVRSDFAFFDNVQDLDWGQTYLTFLEKVEATSSTEDYYRALMQLAPLLKDGHTNIYPPKELASKFFAKPPMQTALIENKVLVTRIDSAQLKALVDVGDEIVQIDGVPVRTYAEVYVNPFVSSSTPQDRLVRQYSYQLLHGDENKPVRLQFKGRAGALREAILPRKGYNDIVAPTKFEFRLLPGNIAYISIDHFESDAGVIAFESAFPSILKARGLIIDVRNNGGGSTEYGMRILRFLTNEPIRGANSYSRGDNGLSRNDGTIIKWTPLVNGGTSDTRTRPVVFSGPVTVLTGPKTFSAGEDFVAAFQTAARGRSIGSATGGSTGQPILIKLPGGGSGRICAKRDTFADGSTFVGKGLTPGTYVTQTLVDFYAGRDTVLDRSVAELNKVP